MLIGLEAQSFESYPQGGREIRRQQRKGGVRREKKEMDGESFNQGPNKVYIKGRVRK